VEFHSRWVDLGVFFSEFQLFAYLVFFPEFADFLFQLKRFIICSKAEAVIGFGFSSQLSSQHTRKYKEIIYKSIKF
jgi:hypothetical protein